MPSASKIMMNVGSQTARSISPCAAPGQWRGWNSSSAADRRYPPCWATTAGGIGEAVDERMAGTTIRSSSMSTGQVSIATTAAFPLSSSRLSDLSQQCSPIGRASSRSGKPVIAIAANVDDNCDCFALNAAVQVRRTWACWIMSLRAHLDEAARHQTPAPMACRRGSRLRSSRVVRPRPARRRSSHLFDDSIGSSGTVLVWTATRGKSRTHSTSAIRH